MTTPTAPKKRQLRPRTPIIVTPVSVTSDNCASVAGVEPRRFRDLVRTARIPHARVGSLVIVDVDDWRAALATMTAANDITDPDAEATDPTAAPTTAAGVLAALGLQPMGGRR